MTFATAPGTGNLPNMILVARDGARAEIYLHGAHLTSWIPAASLADLEPGGDTRMLCIEAVAAAAPVALDAGCTWRGSQRPTAR